MIPTLYPANAVSFNTNGLGRLSDCLTGKVVEQRNGAYEMELTIPTFGNHFSEIGLGSIITAKPSPTRSSQPFEVYEIQKDMSGMIATVKCQHISYRQSLIPVNPFTASSANAALQGLKTNSQETNPFTYWTDVTRAGTYSQKVPSSVKNRLQGEQGSVLQTYQGEYEWDGFTVKLHAARGLDRGVQIRYGKNLMSLKQEQKIENTITGIMPYWTKTENDTQTVITLPEGVVYASTASSFPFHRTVVMDFSGDFSEAPTVAELRQAANSYITTNNIGYPSVSLDVSFAELSQTKDYMDLGQLEWVELCDTVTVIFPDFDISTSAKVIETDYDFLNEKYNSVKIGDAVTTLAATIAQAQKDITTSETLQRSRFQEELERATAVINGDISGSSMKTLTDANGLPQGLIIMDTNNESTAVNCIRLNANGIGFSNSGINGPYSSAWLIDGTFDASKINVINLSADSITSGEIDARDVTISHLSATNIDSGTLDASDVTVVNLSASSINSGTLAAAYIDSGVIQAINSAQQAAEDAQDTADSANAREQRIYKSAVAGTSSMAATTTWVTSATNSQNAWTTQRPDYNASYPVLFTAMQRQTVEQMAAGSTCSCTTPVVDRTTTIIDGGRIITHSLNVDKISGSLSNTRNWSLDFDNGTFSIGTISATNIYGGTLTLGGANNGNGTLIVKDASDATIGTVNNTGVDFNGTFTSTGTDTAHGGAKAKTVIDGGDLWQYMDLPSASSSTVQWRGLLGLTTHAGTTIEESTGYLSSNGVLSIYGKAGLRLSGNGLGTPAIGFSSSRINLNGEVRQNSGDCLIFGSFTASDAAQITRTTATGSGWHKGRDNALIVNSGYGTASVFHPLGSMKTKVGSWAFGTLAPNAEELYFVYVTDANHDSDTNVTNRIFFRSDGSSNVIADRAKQDESGNTITSTYVKKAGDTMTGALTVSSGNIQASAGNIYSGTTTSTAEQVVGARNSNGYVCLDVNAGGRRGIWDSSQQNWMLSRIKGSTASVTEGNLYVGTGSEASTNRELHVRTSKGEISLIAAADTNGTRGLYDNKNDSWMVYRQGTSGNVYVVGDVAKTTTNTGYWLVDSSGSRYAGVHDNGTNLWIGSNQGSGRHHTGSTYISTGWNATSNTGNSTIILSVPNAAQATSHSTYQVTHSGNFAARFKTVHKTPSATPSIGANSSGDVTISLTESGYTFMGIVGFTTKSSYVYPAVMRAGLGATGNITITLRNTGSSTYTSKPEFTCLYVKTDGAS